MKNSFINMAIKLSVVPITIFCTIVTAQDQDDIAENTSPFQFESTRPAELYVGETNTNSEPNAPLTLGQSTMLLAVRITSDYQNFGHLRNLGIDADEETLDQLVKIAWQARKEREEAYAARVEEMCAYYNSSLDRSLTNEARIENAIKISEGDDEVESDLQEIDLNFRQAILDAFGNDFYQEILVAKDNLLNRNVSYKSVSGREFFSVDNEQFINRVCQEN